MDPITLMLISQVAGGMFGGDESASGQLVQLAQDRQKQQADFNSNIFNRLGATFGLSSGPENLTTGEINRTTTLGNVDEDSLTIINSLMGEDQGPSGLIGGPLGSILKASGGGLASLFGG